MYKLDTILINIKECLINTYVTIPGMHSLLYSSSSVFVAIADIETLYKLYCLLMCSVAK